MVPWFLAAMALTGSPACRGRILWTFDDGPNYRATPKELALLDAYGIGRDDAVWFILGGQLLSKRHRRLLRQIARKGYRIANHLWTHRPPCRTGPMGKVLSLRGVLWELGRNRRWVRRYAGAGARVVRWYRPPGGQMCRAVTRAVHRRGYRIVLWHVADLGSTPRKMFLKIWRRSISGRRTIVLVHHNWKRFGGLLRLLSAAGCLGGRNGYGSTANRAKVRGATEPSTSHHGRQRDQGIGCAVGGQRRGGGVR